MEVDLNLFADQDERRGIIRQLDRSREATDLETQLRCKNGQIIKVEISLRYVEIDGDSIRLTNDGLLRVDGLLPAFFEPEFQGVRYT